MALRGYDRAPDDYEPGFCICGDRADGYDARREQAVCEACAETPILVPDGGEEIDDALEYDPRSFNSSWMPAVVRERLGDGETAPVSFATVDLRDSGVLYWRTWDGESGYLPEWRWTEVSFLETVRVKDDDDIPTGKRTVAPSDWSRLPEKVREAVEAPAQEVAADV